MSDIVKCAGPVCKEEHVVTADALIPSGWKWIQLGARRGMVHSADCAAEWVRKHFDELEQERVGYETSLKAHAMKNDFARHDCHADCSHPAHALHGMARSTEQLKK